MNYWIYLATPPVSTMDIFFKDTLQGWDRLQATLAFGYVIRSVEPEHS
jgi:hypothetical protein